MMYFISLVLWSFSALAQQSSPVLDPNKYTVCAITINSDDEKKVFDAQVKKYPDKFNPIVELTDFGKDDWFKKSCESNLKCDQLIISGHFGGDFFSEKGDKSLQLKELEEASCAKSCEGVLKNPLEVFLFGCNTLSEREADSRTPAQYLQVLLADGIPRVQAEMVVESRYGRIGDSHKASMQRIFSGDQKQIYGFDSIGPSGKNVKGFLNNYFAKVNAPKRIELLDSKRLMSKVDLANKALAESLNKTAFTQCSGGDIEDPVTKNLCALKDKSISIEKKLDLIHGLLAEENYLGYLPSINTFFKKNSPQDYTPEQKKELALISENKVIKQQIDGLIATTKSLTLKNEWASFAQNVGFITADEQKALFEKSIVGSFDKKMTLDDAEILCKLDSSITTKLDIKFDQIINKQWGEAEASALNCLNAKDPAIFQHVAQLLKNEKNPETIAKQMSLLTKNDETRPQIDPIVFARTKNILASKNDYYRFEAIIFFTKFAPKEPALHQLLQSYMNSKNDSHKQLATNMYLNMKTTDPKVFRQMSNNIKNSRDPSLVTLSVFSVTHLKVTDPEIIQELKDAQSLPHLNDTDRMFLKSYLTELK